MNNYKKTRDESFIGDTLYNILHKDEDMIPVGANIHKHQKHEWDLLIDDYSHSGRNWNKGGFSIEFDNMVQMHLVSKHVARITGFNVIAMKKSLVNLYCETIKNLDKEIIKSWARANENLQKKIVKKAKDDFIANINETVKASVE